MKSESFTYKGTHGNAVAMPLGGIGTGTIALCADGSLRQWQLFNTVNHDAWIPDSFFAVRCQSSGASSATARVLMQKELRENLNKPEPAPLVSDHIVPPGLSKFKKRVPCMERTEFEGKYPFATIRYHDAHVPLRIVLSAFSPLIPLNVEDSSLPGIYFRFTFHNDSAYAVTCSLLGAIQNVVGYDGLGEVEGVNSIRYGGNSNQHISTERFTGMLMKNERLGAKDARNGNLSFGVIKEGSESILLTSWDSVDDLWNSFVETGTLPSSTTLMPSPQGKTLNAAVLVPGFSINPGDTEEIVFLLTWYFPHRYLNWHQVPRVVIPDGISTYLGNEYGNRFQDSLAAADYMARRKDDLFNMTQSFQNDIFSSGMPEPVIERVTSQISVLRSPTCFITADGTFYGFEGCCGASAPHFIGEGSCPLNCTHVWNYEMTLAHLFPSLERTMREVELFHQLDPKGELPHRVTLPLSLPRPWDTDIGGPLHCALDGMLGAILKAYREVLISGNHAWLEKIYEPLKRLRSFIFSKFDPERKGIIEGEQPNTYDISTYGPNTFIGSLWLAALCALERLADIMNDDTTAQDVRERFERGKEGYDKILWNGEYYDHTILPGQTYENGWGKGCHSDQLIGVWWAKILDLGEILPREHVKEALRSIYRFNFKESLEGIEQQPRRFACEDEAGLLNCTWPYGGRPETPILYCDEVWTGIEYEIAALMFFEGMLDEGLRIVQAISARYDGSRRNPFNEIECGDHYVRALASWSMILALSGFHYDGIKKELTIKPGFTSPGVSLFFTTATGWGTFCSIFEKNHRFVLLSISAGYIDINGMYLPVEKTESGSCRTVQVVNHNAEVRADFTLEDEWVHIIFTQPIRASSSLEINIT